MELEVLKKVLKLETSDAGQKDELYVNNNKISDYPEQENLELLNVVDGEINLPQMENMSEDE